MVETPIRRSRRLVSGREKKEDSSPVESYSDPNPVAEMVPREYYVEDRYLINEPPPTIIFKSRKILDTPTIDNNPFAPSTKWKTGGRKGKGVNLILNPTDDVAAISEKDKPFASLYVKVEQKKKLAILYEKLKSVAEFLIFLTLAIYNAILVLNKRYFGFTLKILFACAFLLFIFRRVPAGTKHIHSDAEQLESLKMLFEESKKMGQLTYDTVSEAKDLFVSIVDGMRVGAELSPKNVLEENRWSQGCAEHVHRYISSMESGIKVLDSALDKFVDKREVEKMVRGKLESADVYAAIRKYAKEMFVSYLESDKSRLGREIERATTRVKSELEQRIKEQVATAVEDLRRCVEKQETFKNDLAAEMKDLKRHVKEVKEEREKIQEYYDLSQIDRLPHNIQEEVRRRIEKMAETYEFDGDGHLDYALNARGTVPILEHSSATYRVPVSWYKRLLYRRKEVEIDQSHAKALTKDIYPGMCWVFKGNRGYLTIKLFKTIVPTHVSICHVDSSLVSDRSSAPRNFEVYGGTEKGGVLMFSTLGKFTYDANMAPRQCFKLENADPYTYIRVEFRGNHGKREYTCVYRLGVYEIMEKSDGSAC